MKINFKKLLFFAVVIILAVALNHGGSILASKIVFPLYLDSLFTIGVVALCGLIPGLLCAFLSNLVLTLSTGSTLLFSLCHISTALISWFVLTYEKKQLKKKQIAFSEYSLDIFLWAGFWAALSNGIFGNIIADFVYGSNPVLESSNIVIQGIFVAFPNLKFANNFAGLTENLVDKMISALLSFGVYKAVPKQFKDSLKIN